MIVLVVHSSRESIDQALGALKATRAKEVHTASSYRVAIEAGEQLEHLDILITGPLRGDEGSGIDLRDALRERFPGLRAVFLGKRERFAREGQPLEEIEVVELPEEHEKFMEWAGEAGLAKRRSPVTVQVQAIDDHGEEDLPAAQAVAAPARELADFRLMRLLGSETQTETHEAHQASIDRHVALVLLKPEFCEVEEHVREFRGAVRAKAVVSHPNIIPVFDGFEDHGVLFYTRELVDGAHLDDLAAEGEQLQPRAIFNLIKTVVECMNYFQAQGIPYADLEPRHVFIGRDGKTRLSNIATLETTNVQSTPEHIRTLGYALQPLLATNTGKPGLMAKLLGIMASEEYSIESWDELLMLMRGIDNRIAESEIAQPPRVNRAWKRRSKRKWGAAVAGLAGVIALIAFLAWPDKQAKPAPDLGTSVAIRGGEFIFQDGKMRTVRPFEIDRYEVTIGEYAEFLKALATAGNPKSYDHFLQKALAPDKSGHEPADWERLYEEAKNGGEYMGQSINLNCPIVLVDWWDAWAYAKWKGRRLPTETEWERAARGNQGNLYAWGDEFDFTKLNTAKIDDAYAYWSPVDAFPDDRSPDGVVGMSGNVSEWTGTWVDHPDIPDKKIPMARGASFATDTDDPANFLLTNNSRLFKPNERVIYLGFRTVGPRDG